MGKVYSRNLARRQNFFSSLAQKAFKEYRTADSLTTATPEISEENQIGEKSPNAEILCGVPADWDRAILKTGKSRRTQKGPKGFKGSFRGSFRNRWAVWKWPTRKPRFKFPPRKTRC